MTDLAPALAGPSASSVQPTSSTSQMTDGTNLRTLTWSAENEPVAIALILHGLGEHAGRYGNVAAALTAAGIETQADDLRGNGESGGPRNDLERWELLHDDIEARMAAIRAADAGLPVILYGHSLGGLIVCGYVLADPARPLPDLLVLSSPGLGDNLPRWKHSLSGRLSGIVPKLRLANGIPDGVRSHDPSIQEAYDRDPLASSTSSVRFGAQAFAEQDRVNAVLATLDAMPVPTYVFHGSDDALVPVSASAVFEGMGNTTRHVHDGLLHECHHESEHEHVLAEVVSWVGSQGVPVRVPDEPPSPAEVTSSADGAV